jgi:hypothetical protein
MNSKLFNNCGMAESAKATKFTFTKIEKHFGIKLPDELRYLSTHLHSFTTIFASLGNDFNSRDHIVKINSYWRRRRRTRKLPNHFIIFSKDHDADCYCFKIDPEKKILANEIYYWTPGILPEPMADSFMLFLDDYAKRKIRNTTFMKGSDYKVFITCQKCKMQTPYELQECCWCHSAYPKEHIRALKFYEEMNK